MLTNRLPYTTQRLGHARPALRPVRVVWRPIPLGHRPSLPLLRRPSGALFARFFGTLLVSDFSRPYITGVGTYLPRADTVDMGVSPENPQILRKESTRTPTLSD